MIIDSRLQVGEVLQQNPDSVCPNDIFDTIGVMEVHYWGFDHKEHLGQIAVAQSVMPEVESFFNNAFEIKFPINAVIPAADQRYRWDDNKLMANNISSGFNYRLIAGRDTPSLHALGRAFDVNPRQNPYIRYEGDNKIVAPEDAVWNPELPGTLHVEHPLVKLMEGFGWEWGGHWLPESGRTDYQHFQKP